MRWRFFKLMVYIIVPSLVLSCFPWDGASGSVAVSVNNAHVATPLINSGEHTSSIPTVTEAVTEKATASNAAKPTTAKPTTTKKSVTKSETTNPTEQPTAAKAQTATENCEPAAEKLIALTFDDGPNEKNTSRILDILEENDSKATFFVIGTNAKKYPDIIKRAADMGCEIGSHSCAHSRFKKMSAAKIQEDMKKMKKIIKATSGTEPVLFRVPYGSYNDKVKSAVGMPLIQWSIDTDDWIYKTTTSDKRTQEEIDRDMQKIINSVLDNAKDGDIVLMHDIYSMSANACEVLIPKLREMGFKLVTVSELMDAKGIKMENGEVYRKAY